MFFIPDELKPYFKLSLGFHIALFLFFGVKVLIFPDLSDLDQEGSIRVDMVALPNLEDNKKLAPKPEEKKIELPKPTPPKKVAESIKPQPAKKIVEKKPEVKTVDESLAFQKLQELEALKKLSQTEAKTTETTPEPEAQPTATTEPPTESVEIKGNRIAVGDNISGVNRIQYTNYKKILHDAVKAKWNLPSWIQDGGLFAEAMVKISETGHITEQTLSTSSGNSMYDKYVMQAISEASPFPPPPDKFVNIVGVKGVVLRFP